MAAIAVPAIASVTVAIFIGWVLIFIGLVLGAQAWGLRGRARVGRRALHAALALVVGICLVVFPLTGVFTLTALLAAWFLASGALYLSEAWELRGRSGSGLLAVDGALSLVLALLIIVGLPSTAAWAIGLLVGVNLVFFGVRALIAWHAINRVVEP
jgi:uncharacterized membrane protein HdeD (DUF308 family)